MQFDFDRIIDRRNTHCAKWDMMETYYGVSPDDGLSMWVADMDFRPPAVVANSVQKMVDHGIFGYFGDYRDYHNAIIWWMQNRHGWQVDADWIFSTAGLVNGAALCVQTWSEPGDAVVMFTPIYHSFATFLKAAGREIRECPMPIVNGRYELDLKAAADCLTGREKILLFCSPHNPGGRVWRQDELSSVADFCAEHDLLLISDEIHHDLVFAPHRHILMPLAAPKHSDRMVTMSAPTKTFNIAGAHNGNVIIQNPRLRAEFAGTLQGLGISPNAFGLHMQTAAYSPEGAEWLDAAISYIDTNRQIFDQAINAIPGLRSMPLESTYLAWVDFSGTGMAVEEFTSRVQKIARIAANHGSPFGKGGETFLRFNLATQRSRVVEATERLQAAFQDLQ
ncbi:MAG: pyridoxal phosphate-dependent aminotransferase [Rhodobacteraceae bacterium]|nr:pyridoxal phosphate-dependent aminotransferase [Paracoccaceae bacterium]